MNRTLATALALALVGATAPLAAQAVTPAATLTVTGYASITHAPDRATVPLTIVTNEDVAGRAVSANNAKYAAISAALVQHHIATSAIKTTGFSSQYNARPLKPDLQFAQRFGYVVTRSLSIEVDDLGAVGGIIDAVTAAGAPDIGAVSYGLRDTRAIQRTAQEAAIRDARTQAAAQASAAGVHIVRVLAIGAPAPSFNPGVVRAFAAAKVAEVPTDIQPSDLSVDANVTVTYEIAEGANRP